MANTYIEIQRKFCTAVTVPELQNLVTESLDTIKFLEGQVAFRDGEVKRLKKMIANKDRKDVIRPVFD